MTNPFLFEGELGRRGFFWSYLVNLIALIVALYFLFWLDEPIGVILFSILTIIRYWFNFSFRARRCHDLGWSGWWQFVPLMDFLLAILEKGQRKLRNVYASITISVFALMFGFNLMDDYRYRRSETFMARLEWEQNAESYSQLIEDNAELNVSVAYPKFTPTPYILDGYKKEFYIFTLDRDIALVQVMYKLLWVKLPVMENDYTIPIWLQELRENFLKGARYSDEGISDISPNTYYYRKTSCSVEGTKTVDAAYDPDNELLYLYIKSEAEAYEYPQASRRYNSGRLSTFGSRLENIY